MYLLIFNTHHFVKNRFVLSCQSLVAILRYLTLLLTFVFFFFRYFSNIRKLNNLKRGKAKGLLDKRDKGQGPLGL